MVISVMNEKYTVLNKHVIGERVLIWRAKRTREGFPKEVTMS